MKRRRPMPRLVEDEESPPAEDGALLFSVFLSPRQQADLHLPPFDVEGEALPAVADPDAPAD